MRKLVTLRTIDGVQPIPNSDHLEVATVGGWKVVTRRGEFMKGDLALYFEVDSFLPEIPEFEFLRKSSYRTLNGVGGFRIKTIKLRGQLSQGLLQRPYPFMDAGILPETLYAETDYSEALGVIKWDPPVRDLEGAVVSSFPHFIPKTDQERIQNLSKKWEKFKESKWDITEKLDGTSFTAYYNDGKFGVCSRNLDVEESQGNLYWDVANTRHLRTRMENYSKSTYTDLVNFAIQGEIIGEGVQGNPYGIRGKELRVFDIFNIDTQTKLSIPDMIEVCKALGIGLKWVPYLGVYTLPDTIDELLETVASYETSIRPKEFQSSEFLPGWKLPLSEGWVFKNVADPNLSFKVISNRFLLKEK